ncbi:MAG: hypothetical protein P9M03_00200 [Candidatus Theseobacter exili]|nr:hypothetical protein [Candidatus Theseobacter exili]
MRSKMESGLRKKTYSKLLFILCIIALTGLVSLFCILNFTKISNQKELLYNRDILKKITKLPAFSPSSKSGEEGLVEILDVLLAKADIRSNLFRLRPGQSRKGSAFVEADIELRRLTPEQFEYFLNLIESDKTSLWLEQANVLAVDKNILNVTLKLRMQNRLESTSIKE